MCGRLTIHYTWQELHRRYSLTNPNAPSIRPNYNAVPSQRIPVITLENDEDDALVLAEMRWGLVPSWWKKPLKDLPSTINARAETVHEKPMFRSAFKNRRCVIPASGFYEWQRKGGSKEPFYISMSDEPFMAFAGIFDVWDDPSTGEEVLSCSIITCPANDLVSELHDRMPVILGGDDWEKWLFAPMKELLLPCPSEWLQKWQVSRGVNKPSFNEPACVEPVIEQQESMF